jgi:hypothetical protein
VSISNDGNTVAIGARLNNGGSNSAGHVRVFGYSGSAWVQIGDDIDGEMGLEQTVKKNWWFSIYCRSLTPT